MTRPARRWRVGVTRQARIHDRSGALTAHGWRVAAALASDGRRKRPKTTGQRRCELRWPDPMV